MTEHNTEHIAEENTNAGTDAVPSQDRTVEPAVEVPPMEDGSTVDEARDQDHHDDGDTFPREYVEELREENKRYRHRAKQADALAERLHNALVRLDGRLQDATDLPYSEDHLDDDDALERAIDNLLERKPHLRRRKASGTIGAGHRGAPEPAKGFDIVDALRNLR